MVIMNRKKLDDWNSGTVSRILHRHPNGFVGFTVVGERGSGKSMYAYKVMARVYQLLEGLDEKEAYRRSLDCMIFKPGDLISLIKRNIDEDRITPVICLDDATVHFNSYKFFTDLYEVILLKGMFDTIRTVISSLLITCPNRKHLLSFMRNYNDYKVDIKMAPGGENYDRYARCYQFNWYPDERKFKVVVPFQDKYSCYVPNWAFDPYMEKRKRYLKDINDNITLLMQKKQKKQK